jgi:Arc-like DNA binding domain
MARKLTDEVQLKLRFSEALRRRLAREARRQKHSLNTEIVTRLDQSLLSQRGDKTTLAAKALLASLDTAVVEKLVELSMERDIFKYAAKETDEGSK